jgi:hypothetical protein
MAEFICSFLKQSGDLLNILGMIGIALLTVLIPVAVAIFDKDKDFDVLDNNVLLDHVVRARYFLLYLALIYIPLLLWTASSYTLRFFELVSWSIGIYLVATVLLRSYSWMKGDKFPLRFQYLRSLTGPEDSEEAWRSVWESNTEALNAPNELEFFKIFSETVDNLMDNDERES